MLIALELAGFKSFADKTRFEFPDGITVIVGPNGSGKSNVVDAIKWVLGSQSAKSLRGQEMADVIFKGSSGSGRKPSGSAEATLVFDNVSKTLPIETDQVEVTRRVYRSGESEYLINQQPARLKDIRNLFRGTGVGVDAYSLIEQGKVDRMLQASPKERRVIFEEAAGISRFNAKKEEAARRLVRVDQNLLRLKDIVDEVHSRLSTLKGQASKAQKFREMTSRLHEIRLSLGWSEYCEWQEKISSLSLQIEQSLAQQQAQQLDFDRARTSAQTAELELHQLAEQIQELEASLQNTLQRTAVAENQRQSLIVRVDEADQQFRRHLERLTGLRQRDQELQGELKTANEQLQLDQLRQEQAAEQSQLSQREVRRLTELLNESTSGHESLRKDHARLWREATEKSNAIALLKAGLIEVVQAIAQAENSRSETQASQRTSQEAAQSAAQRLTDIQSRHQSVFENLENARDSRNESRELLSRYQEEAAVLQGRLEGAAERLEILQELRQHLEGVDAGARYLLNLKASNADPVFQSVHGLVADLIQVDVSIAPLIDTALGAVANALVLRDGQLIELARLGQLQVPGRLTLMRMDRVPKPQFGEKVQLDGVSGVMGRADRLIRCRRDVHPLIRYLLGTTWLVESLEIALELGHFRGAGLRFVTADCQLIDADGTITLGSLSTSSALVSRGSEIRSAQDEIAECRSRYQKLQTEIEAIQGNLRHLNPNVQQLEATAAALAQELAHQQAVAQAAKSKVDDLEKQTVHWTSVLGELQLRHLGFSPQIASAESLVAGLNDQISAVEHELQLQVALVKEHQSLLSLASDAQVAAKVELARIEQRLEATTTALEQVERNCRERQQAVEEVEAELKRQSDRKQQAESEITKLATQIDADRLTAQEEEARLDALAESAKSLRDRRTESAKQLDTITRSVDRVAQQIETSRVECERLGQASSQLLQRYAEEYQVDLETLQSATRIESSQRVAELTVEASQLRQDMASVGEINMAALVELDQLQQRYDHLNGQYEDLRAAKESLQRIVQKINGDSRRLFLETLEIIRQNFQKLYRKSFGGGHADIVLEQGVDPLECGIDIIATPPGKTAFSNSLLSGGEKALTAVALLLAIFQYRPSPFCVLDEVDAPFDEANIGRFVNVLGEFLEWTKFIVVTHSKKTMTAATTLYGVTMQESGVSRQVAVRFEDVNEKGEIISRNPQARKAA